MYIDRVGSTTLHNLYRILVTTTCVMGMKKMENIAPRVGIKPKSFAIRASVLTIIPYKLPDVSLLYPTLRVLVAHLLRCECRLSQ